jgi:phage portal protein BeeE
MHTNTFIADQRSGSVELPAIPHVAARDQLAYSMENPIYPLTDPSIFSEGLVAVSGHRVSPIKSLHLPAVYQAVTRIAGDIARCPLELYVENDGICKALLDDPIHRLTAIQPNREMDAFKFWNRVVTQRLVWQNAYIFIAPNAAGDPVELLPLLADRTHPKRAGGKLFYVTETSEAKSRSRPTGSSTSRGSRSTTWRRWSSRS